MIIPKQMIPAPGWFAIIGEQSPYAKIPLVCWAICEDTETKATEIHGMIADEDGNVFSARTVDNFDSYDLELEDYEIVEDILN